MTVSLNCYTHSTTTLTRKFFWYLFLCKLCKLSSHFVRLPDCKSGLVLILLWLSIGLLLEAWVAYFIFSELKICEVDPERQISTHLFRFNLFKLHTYLVPFYLSLEIKTIKHFMLPHHVPMPLSGVSGRLVKIWGHSQVRLQFPKCLSAE